MAMGGIFDRGSLIVAVFALALGCCLVGVVAACMHVLAHARQRLRTGRRIASTRARWRRWNRLDDLGREGKIECGVTAGTESAGTVAGTNDIGNGGNTQGNTQGGEQGGTQGDMRGYSQDDGMTRQPMPNMTSTAHGDSPAAASSHATPREQRAGYRADVDGLRAVAVIAVIVFHLDESYLPGGFTGVDSFFVISGFVVSSSLLSRPAPSAAQLLLGFYSRRVRRLMPALVVTVLATAITISMVVPPEASGLDSYYASAQLALVGMANNIYAAQTTGYWERGQQTMEFNPFTHMWSLGVEGEWLHRKNPPTTGLRRGCMRATWIESFCCSEQFYFIFPALVVLAYGRRASLAASPKPWCRAATPRRVLWMSWVISVLVCAALSVTQPRLAFYVLPSRFWQLMTGGILYEWQAGFRSLPPDAAAASLVSNLSIALLELLISGLFALAFMLTDGESAFPLPWSLLQICATSGYIALGSLRTRRTWGCGVRVPSLNALLSYRPIAYVGRIS